MSRLASTRIPPPADEQAFERASVVLWSCLLGDPAVERNGTRGQRQDGVDLYGMRNSDPGYLVGIQCKAKGHGKKLTEREVRDELNKALGFKPPLREYFITTTAPDDSAMQELARTLSQDLHGRGRALTVRVWGWNALEERIAEHPAARQAFDPTYSPYGALLQQEKTAVRTGVSEVAFSLAR